METGSFAEKYIDFICRLYGDVYDDREEDSRIRGLNWEPGRKAAHKSMAAFQKELLEEYGIRMSRTKLQKILISGGRWTTERSREVQRLFGEYTAKEEDGGKGLKAEEAVREIAGHLGISTVSVVINLPYGKTVYDLEEKSGNARRIEKWRRKKIQNSEFRIQNG